MNIQVVPGSSSKPFAQQQRILAYGPYMPRRRLAEFYKSYVQGGDLTYDYQRFVHLTLGGHIVNYEVAGFSGPLCRMGIEVMVDRKGPYVSLLYIEGVHLADYAGQIAMTLFHVALQINPTQPRARIRGRKGWKRWIWKHCRISIDKKGFVNGNQEYFKWAHQAVSRH